MRTGKNGAVAAAVIAFALLLASGAVARAELRIVSSLGGEVESYLRLFAMIRESGERVIIDGPCLSACTTRPLARHPIVAFPCPGIGSCPSHGKRRAPAVDDR